MTHVVHGFYFGTRPTPRKYYELKKLHPLGLNPEWLDKLHGQEFFSEHTQHTHEHYLQVCDEREGKRAHGGLLKDST